MLCAPQNGAVVTLTTDDMQSSNAAQACHVLLLYVCPFHMPPEVESETHHLGGRQAADIKRRIGEPRTYAGLKRAACGVM